MKKYEIEVNTIKWHWNLMKIERKREYELATQERERMLG